MSWIQYTSVHVEMLDVLLKTILCNYGGKVLTNRDLYEKLEIKMAPIKSGRYLEQLTELDLPVMTSLVVNMKIGLLEASLYCLCE